MPRIAVVGVAVDDYIRRADGKVIRSLGGIAYSVSVMAALTGPDAEVLPVCRVAHAQRDRLLDEWSVFSNVSDLGLVPWAGPASQVTLEYRGGGRIGGDREERLLYPTPPLAAHEIDVALAADAILLNCVTGAVLTGGALQRLAASRTPVHLDVHSLILGRTASGVRYPERPADWRCWIDVADTLQCNEQEATVLAEPTASDGARSDAVGRFVRSTLARPTGPDTVVITRGAEGVDLFEGEAPGVRVAAPQVEIVDPTGAGDAFGAAFVVERVGGADAASAARAAVRAASAACLLSGTAAIASLPATIASLRNPDVKRAVS